MKRNALFRLCAVISLSFAGAARADLLALSDGRILDGKIESAGEKEVVFQPDGAAGRPAPPHRRPPCDGRQGLKRGKVRYLGRERLP